MRDTGIVEYVLAKFNVKYKKLSSIAFQSARSLPKLSQQTLNFSDSQALGKEQPKGVHLKYVPVCPSPPSLASAPIASVAVSVEHAAVVAAAVLACDRSLVHVPASAPDPAPLSVSACP